MANVISQLTYQKTSSRKVEQTQIESTLVTEKEERLVPLVLAVTEID